MPVIEFQISLVEGAAYGMRIKQTKNGYKGASKLSASPIFQQMKVEYVISIAGFIAMLEAESLIHYFGCKISKMTLLFCKEILLLGA